MYPEKKRAHISDVIRGHRFLIGTRIQACQLDTIRLKERRLAFFRWYSRRNSEHDDREDDALERRKF